MNTSCASPGAVFFHGTLASNVVDILHDGLEPRAPGEHNWRGYPIDEENPKGVYLHPSRAWAEDFAVRVARGVWCSSRPEKWDIPIVLEVCMDDLPVDWDADQVTTSAVVCAGRIPPERIVRAYDPEHLWGFHDGV